MVKRNSSGQALLIILLIMAVALTIGLSVVSRSITDIRISQEQEESARAFSAAEAGLESLLATGGAPGAVGDFTITTDTRDLGNNRSFIFPGDGVAAGDTKTVWLVSHDGDDLLDDFRSFTDFTFHWGNEGLSGNDDTDPALEAVIIYDEGGTIKTRRVAFDPRSGRSDGFSSATIGDHSFGDKTFSFRINFTDDRSFPTGSYYVVRIKLLYNDQPQILGIEASGGDLPLQGNCYASTATSGTTGIARKVEQCQYYPFLPGMFDYVLYSGSGL